MLLRRSALLREPKSDRERMSKKEIPPMTTSFTLDKCGMASERHNPRFNVPNSTSVLSGHRQNDNQLPYKS
ncbi:hypothetical protein NPIL_251261 [Nephila pilipes]|uniref:Uncharacterized protein n=1 Tax=Nephila pilipes TaxID=299642 RepID=A0A8X6QNI0_NEPPI|nr:hypothetical protein NPIL_251261 [Nephila pilipes]